MDQRVSRVHWWSRVGWLLLLGLGWTAPALRASERGYADSLYHQVSLLAGFAVNDTNHFYYRGNNPDGTVVNKNATLHLRYGFGFSPESALGRRYPTAYQGVGVAAYTFFAPRAMGTPGVVYLFQGARILDFSRSLSLGYEWNVGFSWGWEPNEASGSACNVMLNVSLPLTWHLSTAWEVALIPHYTHFSNGDTAFPNSGIDAFGVQVKATRLFRAVETKAPGLGYFAAHPDWRGRSFGEHLTWDVVLYGGWRADRFTSNGTFCLINEPIPNWGLQLNPLYHLNHYFSLGLSLDLFTDRSANLYDAQFDPESGDCIGYARPSLWEQTALSLSARGELRMPLFAVGVGVGLNLVQHGYDMQRFYSLFGLKIFLSQRAYLYLGYRLSALQYTRNIMYGFGYRFGKGVRR